MRGTQKRYAKIDAGQIEACSERLRPNHLKILRASMEGSYADMAQVLSLNIGTVKSRLNRARAALALARQKQFVHPNGQTKFALDGTLLNEQGNRSIFDDVDE